MSKNKLAALVGILLVVVFVLGGYIIFTNKKSERISFENKISCEKYSTDLQEEIAKDNLTYGTDNPLQKRVEMVFYSPVENSCLYLVDNFKVSTKKYEFIDILSKNVIATFNSFEDEGEYEEFVSFLQKRNISFGEQN